MQWEGQTKNRMKNNITPFKNRTIDFNKPVCIYRNLMRKGVVWSVKQDGLVVGHVLHELMLADPQLLVRAAGRQRAIKTKHRNVHAMIKGWVVEDEKNTRFSRITYNPFITDGFVYADTRMPVSNDVRFARFNRHGAFVAK